MGIRFGVDIGVASVGWAVVNDNYEVEEAGSNIFHHQMQTRIWNEECSARQNVYIEDAETV